MVWLIKALSGVSPEWLSVGDVGSQCSMAQTVLSQQTLPHSETKAVTCHHRRDALERFLVLSHQVKCASSDLFSVNDRKGRLLWNPFPCRWASGGWEGEGDSPGHGELKPGVTVAWDSSVPSSYLHGYWASNEISENSLGKATEMLASRWRPPPTELTRGEVKASGRMFSVSLL